MQLCVVDELPNLKYSQWIISPAEVFKQIITVCPYQSDELFEEHAAILPLYLLNP
jgi:hypothetical protein